MHLEMIGNGMSDVAMRIERLEEEIEALTDKAEQCRKIMSLARLGIAIGGLVLVAILLGVLRAGGIGFIVSVSAVLIGIVVLGSNSSTRDEALAQIAERRARRDALIDAIAPRSITRH